MIMTSSKGVVMIIKKNWSIIVRINTEVLQTVYSIETRQ